MFLVEDSVGIWRIKEMFLHKTCSHQVFCFRVNCYFVLYKTWVLKKWIFPVGTWSEAVWSHLFFQVAIFNHKCFPWPTEFHRLREKQYQLHSNKRITLYSSFLINKATLFQMGTLFKEECYYWKTEGKLLCFFKWNIDLRYINFLIL